MVWIVIVAVLAVAGGAALAVYAAGLRHRVESLRAETAVTTDRVKEIATLVRRVDVTALRRD